MKQRLDYYRSTQRRCDFSVPYLQGALQNSLQRLRTDYIDLLMLHKPPADDLRSGRIGEVIDVLRTSAAIRYLGVSCETVDDALVCLEIPGVRAVQITVNLIDQEATVRLLAKAHALGIGVIARNPRAAGLLTENYGDVTAETYARDQAAFESSRDRARQFGFLANSDRTLAQAAIRYVLQLPGISATTPRARTVNEIDEAIRACALPALAQPDLERITQTRLDLEEEVRKYAYRSAQSGVTR